MGRTIYLEHRGNVAECIRQLLLHNKRAKTWWLTATTGSLLFISLWVGWVHVLGWPLRCIGGRLVAHLWLGD